MKKKFRRLCLLALGLLLLIPAARGQETWRSSLYPEDWVPGYADAQGRFLHDFSYAGYRLGAELPSGDNDLIVDATQAPYLADPSGEADATAAIQSALDFVGAAGGGTVYLPEGTYKVAPPEGATAALVIAQNDVVLKGDGAGKTFLYNGDYDMRKKCVLRVGAASDNWFAPADGTLYPLLSDVPATPTSEIHLHSVQGLRAGDWVILRADWTEDFIAAHDMGELWAPSAERGTAFFRRLTSVDEANNTVTLDIPTRHYLLKRDNARLYKFSPSVSGVGLNGFSIGNREYPLDAEAEGFASADYTTEGTAAYRVHAAFLIQYAFAVDCWAADVRSYRPADNTRPVHMVSNGIDLMCCRSVTLADCDFSHPQYEGGGGNGYGFNIRSGDCLIKNCSSTSARHSYSFKSGNSNGNVVYRFRSTDALGSSDFHMYLSPANLVDCQVVDGDVVEANIQFDGGAAGRVHGHSATETVFWNTRGLSYRQEATAERYIVDSRQFGWGYVIGTQGPAWAVKTAPSEQSFQEYTPVDSAPEDFLEGAGRGGLLEPASLWEDQCARRAKRKGSDE